MTHAQIVSLQERIGTTPDGFWGRLSIAAVQRHLRAMMPGRILWPAPSQSALREFYGRPGDESQLETVPAPCPLRFEGRPVKRLRGNLRCLTSLCRALAAAHEVAPETVEDFGGVFANRTMRGGELPSVHAYGAAVDLSPESNGNHTAWPVRATMPIEVMECFAREGWISAGAFWGRDAMHFQATT